MLPRETTKRLTNICTITLRRFGLVYEVIVYPNTLYEYRRNPETPLDRVLASPEIFRSAANGALASAQDLAAFNASREEILRTILNEGHEQKPILTAQYEQSLIERQVLDAVHSKVTYAGSILSKPALLKAIKSVYDIKAVDPRRQVNLIIKKLVEVGFERIFFQVIANPERIGELQDSDGSLIKDWEGVVIENDKILVRSDVLPRFTTCCKNANVLYMVVSNEEAEEEEIC